MNRIHLLALLFLVESAHAGFTVFDEFQRDLWFGTVGEVSTIGFTEYPEHTFITDQYLDEYGVAFVDGADIVRWCKITYPNDGAGLDGNALIELEFTEPQSWLAVDHPGFVVLEIYDGEELIENTQFLGGGGSGFFAGLISNQPFDGAIVVCPFDDQVAIDDLHFGAAQPGDVNHDLSVDVQDLVEVILNWGECEFELPWESYCVGDLNWDDVVDSQDLVEVILHWDPPE